MKSNEYFRFAEPFLCSYRGLSFLLPLSTLDREYNEWEKDRINFTKRMVSEKYDTVLVQNI